MNQQPIWVYETAQEPTAQTTISDLLFGVASVVFGLALAAVVIGLLCGGILIVFRRGRGPDSRLFGDPDATRLGFDE
jgi:hypothetical protein